MRCDVQPSVRCTSGETIPEPLLCDSVVDCKDMSDELDCFTCGSGDNVPRDRRCDGRGESPVAAATRLRASMALAVTVPGATWSGGVLRRQRRGAATMLRCLMHPRSVVVIAALWLPPVPAAARSCIRHAPLRSRGRRAAGSRRAGGEPDARG